MGFPPASSKRTALGWATPRYEKDLSEGGLACPPGILCNPPVLADCRGPLESVVPCPTTQVSCRGGVEEESTPVSSSCCSAPRLMSSLKRATPHQA